MATDESSRAEGALTGSGQMLAGGMAGPGQAQTAPGSEPSAPLAQDGQDDREPPPDRATDGYRRIVPG